MDKSARVATIAIVLFFVAYGLYEGYRFLFVGYKTENAYAFEVAHISTTQGLLVRDEVALGAKPNDEIHYVVDDGTKVIASSVVAYTYEEGALPLAEAEKLEAEKEVLLELQDMADDNDTVPLSDFDDNILVQTREIVLNGQENIVYDIDTIRLEMLENISGKQTVVGNADDYSERINEIDTQLTEKSDGSAVRAGDSGNFSQYSDGYENEISPDIIETLTLETLGTYISADYPYNHDILGKCLKDYKWYYVTTIDYDDIDSFGVGTNLIMEFVGSDERTVKGWVDSVIPYEDQGEAILVVKSDDISPDTVARRTATVNLTFNNYKGVRFSQDALRIVDGVKGVYVKGSSSIQFKKVNIIYTGEDFYLSKLDYNSKEYLNVFDEVVVEGRNMYDNKPLD